MYIRYKFEPTIFHAKHVQNMRASVKLRDTERRFDCREVPRGDRLSGRGSINHGFLREKGKIITA